MTKYSVDFSTEAKDDLKTLKKTSESKRFLHKIDGFLDELKVHPRTGTGKPEQLKGYGEREIWSRRISSKHRLVYEIREEVVIVLVLSAFGYYDDK